MKIVEWDWAKGCTLRQYSLFRNVLLQVNLFAFEINFGNMVWKPRSQVVRRQFLLHSCRSLQILDDDDDPMKICFSNLQYNFKTTVISPVTTAAELLWAGTDAACVKGELVLDLL